MGRGGRWRYTLAGVAGVVVTVGIGFVTNLVSGGITLQGWQWPVMWAVFGVLVLAAAGLDAFRAVAAPSDGSAEPKFAQVRRVYLERLRERYRRIDLEILLPSDQSEHPAMLLGDVFVPQLVRDDPPPRELLDLPREVLLRRVGPGAPGGRPELPDGVDQTRVERAQQAYRGRPARPVLGAVASTSAGVVVLGDPGAGKSTLARYLMLALAAEELGAADGVTAPLPGDLAGRLPLVVELRQFADPRWTDADFLDFLDDRYQREGFGLPREPLERYLRSGGRALVVFDGLDEIFEPKRRNAVARQIDWFAKSHPQARVVVTSRVVGYDRTVFDRAGFTTLMLQDLTRAQIAEFTLRWFERSAPGRPEDALRLRNRIRDAVENSPAVAELAGNPMLLTILAIIARRRELPRDRRSVYEHAVMLLIDQWDVDKELADQHTDLPRLEARDKLRMLHSVARRMQDGPSGLAGNYLPGDDLTELFEDYFTGRLGLPLDRAVQAARTMLQQLRDRNFILASYGAGLYGFVHRAFLEYLAADDINQRFTNRALTEDELLAVYDTHWQDPAWTEVLLLLAGLIPEQFAVTAITRLLDADPAWRARTGPPLHLALALRIAGEIDDSPELAPHARALTLTVIALFEAAVQREALVPGPWTATLVRATSALVTHSPGRRWLDRRLYLRWYRSSGPAVTMPFGVRFTRLAARVVLAMDPPSLSQLKDVAVTGEDEHLRQAAITVLGSAWAGSREALDFLRSRVSGERFDPVQAAALHAIGRAGAGDPDVLAWLDEHATGDHHVLVRHAALEAIGTGWAGDREALALLSRHAAHDDHDDVRNTALEAIGSGWPGDPNALAVIREAGAHDPSRHLRRVAITAAGATGAGDPGTLAWLNERVAQEDTEGARTTAVRTMGARWAGASAAFALLRRYAADDDQEYVRQAAVEAIGAGWAGDREALAVLSRSAAHDPTPFVRSSAMRMLGQGWTGDAEALGLLRRQADQQQDEYLRTVAVSAVGAAGAGDPATLEWLDGLAAHDDSEEVRRAALKAMGSGWAGNAEVLGLLRHCATHDPDDEIRRIALLEAGSAGAGDPGTLHWLCDRAAQDTLGEIRQAAVLAVGAGWSKTPEALTLLEDRALEDETSMVRLSATQMLGSAWPDHPRALETLRLLADHEAIPEVRDEAKRILFYLAESPLP